MSKKHISNAIKRRFSASRIDNALMELKRERNNRDRFYRFAVDQGRLTKEEAEQRNARLDDAIQVLYEIRHLSDQTDLFPAID